MARQTETAKAQVYLDGKQAIAVIDSLKQQSKELRTELSKAVKAGDHEAITKIKQELKGVDAATRSLKKETYDYEKVLKNINGASYNELNKTLRTLNSQYRQLKPQTKADLALRSQLAQKIEIVKTKQRELNLETRAYTSTWSKMSASFNKNWGMVTAGVAALTGAAFGVGQFIKGLTGLDDALANVMKTTGLTRKEVRGLYGDFKQLNTRTKKSVLLEYAEEAGRLGKKGKADVLEFVEVANKIGVALGDDLGDAALATRTIGKMVNIYKVGAQYGVEFGDGMNKIGSGINEIAANSSAAAPYLVDYLNRMAGLAEQSDITAASIIGYGSVLDQSGQKVEMAATAQNKVMLDMFSDIDQYAAMAGMSYSDFATLLETDLNEAFLSVLEGLNGNEQGMTAMTQKLDALGVEGTRAIGVLSVLAGNTDKIRQEQTLANKAMQEGISLTNEYNIKNDNLAGSWEKIQKKMRSVFMNTTLIEKFEGTISSLATSMQDGSFDKFLKFFKNLTVATIAYIAVQKAYYNWEKMTLAIRKARTIAMDLFSGKLKLLTKATKAQTTAQKANNAAVKANLYAAIAAGVVMLVQKLIQLNKEAIKADKTHQQFTKALVQEQGKANDLFNTYKKLNPESEAARMIRKKLVDLYPDLMKNYVDEKGHISDIAAAQKTVNDEIIKTIALRSKDEEISELGEKAYNKQKKGVENILNQTNNSTNKGAAASILSANKSDFENGDVTEKDLADQLANAMDIKIENRSRVTKYDNIVGELRRLKTAAGELKEAKKDVEDFYKAWLGDTTPPPDVVTPDGGSGGNGGSGNINPFTPLGNAPKAAKNLTIKPDNLDAEFERESDADFAKEMAAEKKHGDELLRQYETYLQARQRIKDEYVKDRFDLGVAGGSEEQQQVLKSKEDAELMDLDTAFGEKQAGFEAWADSMLNLGLDQLQAALGQASSLLINESFKSAGGNGDAQKRAAQLQAKIKLLEKQVKAKQQELKTDNNQGKSVEDIAKKYDAASDCIYGVENALGTLADGFADLSPATSEALTAAQNVASGTIGMIQSIKYLSIAAVEGVKGVEKASVILAVIGAALQLVTALFSFLNKKHDEKYSDVIDDLQGRLDNLVETYDRLEKAIDNSFGLQKQKNIEEQTKNLEAQQKVLEEQIAAEKQKKKPDEGAIDSLEEEIDSLQTEIEEMPSIADNLFGADAVSAVEDFASAFVNALRNGDDPVAAMDEIVQDMIASVVTQLTSDNIQDSVNSFRDVLASAWEDGTLSDDEKEAIQKAKQDVYDDAAESTEMIEDSGLELGNDATTQSATVGAIKSITTEQAGVIEGRLTGLQGSTEGIRLETIKFGVVMVEMKGLVINIFGMIEEIRDNTNALPLMLEKLDKIEKNTSEL